MKIFGKHTLVRILLYFVAFSCLLAAAIYYINGSVKPVSMIVFISSFVAFMLFFFAVYYYEIIRPFRIILAEMKALLTGHHYRRIFTNRIDEIGVVAHFFNEVTKNFERISEQIKQGKRMMNELEVASQIQKDVLPVQSPLISGLDIMAKSRPCVELGGDTFDFVTAKDNAFIYIGDVTGHGVPAALVMMMVQTLVHSFVDIYQNALEILVQTNAILKTRIKSTMFMTLLMLRWDLKNQKMYYVGAGHEHLLIYRVAQGSCEDRVSGGIALGMVPDNSKLIKETELPFDKGDVIVLYSDGITEAKNMAGEMFGLERLKKAVELYAPQYGSEGIVYHIAAEFSRFVEDHIQDDDITLIAIRNVGTSEPVDTKVKNISWSDSGEF